MKECRQRGMRPEYGTGWRRRRPLFFTLMQPALASSRRRWSSTFSTTTVGRPDGAQMRREDKALNLKDCCAPKPSRRKSRAALTA